MSSPTDALVPSWFLRSQNRPGVPADRPDLHGQVEGLIEGLGQALRALHDTPTSADELSDPATKDSDSKGWSDLPQGWQALADEIQRAIDGDQVQTNDLPDPYRRYDARRLHEIWIEGRPETEDLVLSHGNPRLASFFFDGSHFVGTEGLEHFCLADRHLDLAIIHQEIHTHLGAEAIFGFYEAYGRDPDLLRLDHYLLGSFLRGR